MKLSGIIALCIAASTGLALGASQNTIYNYFEYSPQLASSAQPASDDFGDIREDGTEVVINLLPYYVPEALFEEEEIVKKQGMQYFHIPVDWDAPTLKDVQNFFMIMDEVRNKKVLTHCLANSRASAFIYLYRTLKQGYPVEQEYRVMETIWEKNKGYELRNVPHWQEFLKEVENDYMN